MFSNIFSNINGTATDNQVVLPQCSEYKFEALEPKLKAGDDSVSIAKDFIYDAKQVALQQYYYPTHPSVLPRYQIFGFLVGEIESNRCLCVYLHNHHDLALKKQCATYIGNQIRKLQHISLAKYSKIQILLCYISIYTLKDYCHQVLWSNLILVLKQELTSLFSERSFRKLNKLLTKFSLLKDTDDSYALAYQLLELLHEHNFFVPNFENFAQHYALKSDFDQQNCAMLATYYKQSFIAQHSNLKVKVQQFQPDKDHIFEPIHCDFAKFAQTISDLPSEWQQNIVNRLYQAIYHFYELQKLPEMKELDSSIKNQLFFLAEFQKHQRNIIANLRRNTEILPLTPENCKVNSIKAAHQLKAKHYANLPTFQLTENKFLLQFYEQWQKQVCQIHTQELARFGEDLTRLQERRQQAEFQRREAILKEEQLIDPINIDHHPSLNPKDYRCNAFGQICCIKSPKVTPKDLFALPYEQDEASLYAMENLGSKHLRDPRRENTLLDAYYEFQYHIGHLQQSSNILPHQILDFTRI